MCAGHIGNLFISRREARRSRPCSSVTTCPPPPAPGVFDANDPPRRASLLRLDYSIEHGLRIQSSTRARNRRPRGRSGIRGGQLRRDVTCLSASRARLCPAPRPFFSFCVFYPSPSPLQVVATSPAKHPARRLHEAAVTCLTPRRASYRDPYLAPSWILCLTRPLLPLSCDCDTLHPCRYPDLASPRGPITARCTDDSSTSIVPVKNGYLGLGCHSAGDVC